VRKCLVVVDMLNDFIRPDGALYVQGAEKIIEPIRQILAKARDEGWLIVYACDHHEPDDPEFNLFPRHCVGGTPGAEVISELAPRQGEVIVRKRRFSPFFETDLGTLLKHQKITHATVVGVVTHICVMETVAGLFYRDIPSTIPLNAVADFDPEMEKAAVKRMEKVFNAKILNSLE